MNTVLTMYLLQVYQWNSLLCVHIYKEDLSLQTIICYNKGEVDYIKAMQ